MAKEKLDIDNAPKEEYDPFKDMVTVFIPRDPYNKEDEPVTINEKSYLIQKGVNVEVPRPVYEVLRDRDARALSLENFIESFEIKATNE